MISKQSLLLTNREIIAINKKLGNKKLTQQDSNYLSRFVRPKLKEIAQLDAELLLNQLEYNQQAISIEKKIISLILKNITSVSSITIYGSAIYTNYTGYKDIDVLVVVKNPSWNKLGEKLLMEKKIEKTSKLKLDIKIYTEDFIYHSYSNNISLIYELASSKTIYGIIKHPKKVLISPLYLRMQADYSVMVLDNIAEIGLTHISARDIYSAIRNLLIIKLISYKVVDNCRLNKVMYEDLGKNILAKLRSNNASLKVKEIAHLYLEELYMEIMKKIENLEKNNLNIEWEENN
ncbi:nucleotidyltransferase domain-containing protein [Candidatus Woesearchaeota archaeon]|nr:nucleotidyltransferase domain-containing protein [Candidatus Woesearchaeota archaeon]